MRKLMLLLGVVKVLMVLLIPSVALGQDDLADAMLDVFEQREQQQQRALWYGALASAAISLPPGVVLARRDDALQHSLGVGLCVGGLAPLLFSLGARKPGPVEQLSLRYAADRVRDPATSLAKLEDAWEQAARDGARKRVRGGLIRGSLGVLSTGAGLVFLLARPGSLGVSEDRQATLGSALLGPGLPLTIGGLRELLVPSLSETSWQSYAGGRVHTRVQLQGAGGAVRLTF